MFSKVAFIIVLYIIFVIFYTRSKKTTSFRPRRRASYLRHHGVLDDETLERGEEIEQAKKCTCLPIMKIIMVAIALAVLVITYYLEKHKGAGPTLLEKYFGTGSGQVESGPAEAPPIKLKDPSPPEE